MQIQQLEVGIVVNDDKQSFVKLMNIVVEIIILIMILIILIILYQVIILENNVIFEIKIIEIDVINIVIGKLLFVLDEFGMKKLLL
jgi:hypothetical protein